MDRPLRYSPTATDHFRNPRNVGRLEQANAIGQVDDRVTENLILLSLRIDDERIVAARFRTFGCSACIAASSILTELVAGQTFAAVRRLDGTTILAALDGLPPGKEHCATLAAMALQAALDNFRPDEAAVQVGQTP